MKTIPATLIPEKHSRAHNSTTGAHYAAKCPYCGTVCIAWPSEWRNREPEGTNKCAHFDGLNTAGAFRFRKGVAVRVTRAGVRINGAFFKGHSLESLAFHFDDLENEGVRNCDSMFRPLIPPLESLFAVSSSYAFGDALNGRFALIRAEVERLYKVAQ